MKKFVAKVEIWLDDDELTIELNGHVNTFRRPPDRNDGPEMFFQVHLPPNEQGNNPDTLAHELGHVVAHIYHTTASVGDDIAQTVGKLVSSFSPYHIDDFKDPMKIKLRAEEEAWEFAHKIYPDVNPAEEKSALDSYRRGIEDARL